MIFIFNLVFLSIIIIIIIILLHSLIDSQLAMNGATGLAGLAA